MTGDLMLAEVLQGFRAQSDYEVALKLFDLVPFEPLGGRREAVDAAALFRRLRRRGVTVRKTIDVLVMRHCIREGHKLLHRDRDFTLALPHLDLQEA